MCTIFARGISLTSWRIRLYSSLVILILVVAFTVNIINRPSSADSQQSPPPTGFSELAPGWGHSHFLRIII